MEVLSHKIYKSICNKQAAKKKNEMGLGEYLPFYRFLGLGFGLLLSLSLSISPSLLVSGWQLIWSFQLGFGLQ